jgi:hypothetical protein
LPAMKVMMNRSEKLCSVRFIFFLRVVLAHWRSYFLPDWRSYLRIIIPYACRIHKPA